MKVLGVLRPAFQMAVDDDVLHKNPFAFELAGVVVNDSVTREAITKEQMNKFLKFIHDDRLLYESQLNMTSNLTVSKFLCKSSKTDIRFY